MIGRTVRAAALVAVAIAALVAAPAAGATPATLKPVTERNGVITADWSPLPAGASSWELQISSTEDFANPLQLPVPIATDTALSYALSQGTYYVRVITTPTLALCEAGNPGCELEISNVMPVTVPPPATHPPEVTGVSPAPEQVSVTWSLPDGYESSQAEIATSPDTYDLDNYFIDVVDGAFLAPADTSYTFEQLDPGTYWIHVASVPAGCFDCGPDWSDPVPVTIPAPVTSSTPPPPPPAPPAADKVLALGAVTASASQKVDQLSIILNPGEAINAKLSGTVSVPGGSKVYRFRSVSKSIGAGAKTKLSLKLPAKGKRVVKKALKRKQKLKAKLTLVITDAAGNAQTKKYTVRLKR